MTGKEKCKLLRQIRKEIAESNGIVYLTSECTYEGECKGTCPKCDAEIRYLDSEIQRLAQSGKPITLSGLSLDTFNAGIKQNQTQKGNAEERNAKAGSYALAGITVPGDDGDSHREGGICEMTIEELDLSVRAYNCLKRAGINVVSELTQLTESSLLKIRNLGKKSAEEVCIKLKQLNLSLSNEVLSFDSLKKIILGFAVGDALGVPVEFETRESLQINPVVDFREYGTHNMPRGTWSDDTSMTLATLDSLVDGLDYYDIMRKFCAWMDQAEYTATGEVFDIGNTTREALCRFKNRKMPLRCGSDGESDNGNGSLMRIIPVVLYAKYKMVDASFEERMNTIHKYSRLTHAHVRSQMACGIYGYVLMQLLDFRSKRMIPQFIKEALEYYRKSEKFKNELHYFKRLIQDDFESLDRSQIKSTGYVVHTLEAVF